MSVSLELVESTCSVCGTSDHARKIASGVDFEYHTSIDSFTMYRCGRCDALFLNPRPARSEFGTIYPVTYHAYEFTEREFGLSYAVRRQIERRRLLDWCGSVPSHGAIVDIGSGDGFHLEILREFGVPTWRLEAVEPDPKSAEAVTRRGFRVYTGFLEELDLDPAQFDFAIMIMVIEHVDDPIGVLRKVHRVLRPGGAIGIVTDNIRAPDARLARGRHWGGYHFPRHFNLYSARSLATLAVSAGFEVERITTMVSPVNWTYTVHNYLEDHSAPGWARRLFTLQSPLALAGFTMVDLVARALGRGALLRAVLRKPGHAR
jgi:SAM-dependent methyltransferase